MHSVQDLPVGVWTHIAATYEVSGNNPGVVKLYMNGMSVATDTDCSFGPALVSTRPLQIGREFPNLPCCGTRTFHGHIDDARVYDRVLTPAEIHALAFPPPTIDSVSASPASLWPPNHKMVPVEVSVSASTSACAISEVSSNEPAMGLGDGGDTTPDWMITGPLSVNLRAERAGGGSGREYLIRVTCTANQQDVSETVAVIVPHDRSR